MPPAYLWYAGRQTRQCPNPRSLSEKEPVYQSIVAVSRVEGDNDSSLLWSLLSRRHAEATDERALQENVSTLGAATLSTGSTESRHQTAGGRCGLLLA